MKWRGTTAPPLATALVPYKLSENARSSCGLNRIELTFHMLSTGGLLVENGIRRRLLVTSL